LSTTVHRGVVLLLRLLMMPGIDPRPDWWTERHRHFRLRDQQGVHRRNQPKPARAASCTAVDVEPVRRAGLEQGLEAGGEWIVHCAASSTDSSRMSCSWAWASVAATVPSATPVAAAISA